MARKENVEEQRGSPLRLSVSTCFADIRDAYRHVLWHQRWAVVLATVFSAAVLVQGSVGFYRLFIGAESRIDLIIFGGGLVMGFALYTTVTDVPALAALAAARSHRSVVTILATGVYLQDDQGLDHVEWSSLKQICFTSHALAIELPQTSAVVSLSDISSSELRRLRRLLVTHDVRTCEAAKRV